MILVAEGVEEAEADAPETIASESGDLALTGE